MCGDGMGWISGKAGRRGQVKQIQGSGMRGPCNNRQSGGWHEVAKRQKCSDTLMALGTIEVLIGYTSLMPCF